MGLKQCCAPCSHDIYPLIALIYAIIIFNICLIVNKNLLLAMLVVVPYNSSRGLKSFYFFNVFVIFLGMLITPFSK